MATVTISQDYSTFLKTAPAPLQKTFRVRSYEGQLMVTAEPNFVLLPPNNANIDFSKAPSVTMQARLQSTAAENNITVPENFNWAKQTPLLTPVQNQESCGCCWAVATATCISDIFVVQRLVPINPDISYTYLMSCWNNEINNKCGGSNPFLALDYIKYNGIATNKTVNFDWCLNNAQCKEKTDAPILNSLIPACQFEEHNKLRFYITNIETSFLEQSLAEHPENLKLNTLYIQKHIFTKGPVIGGFLVFENLVTTRTDQYKCGGDNPDNIYLDQVDYVKGVRNESRTFNLLGSHAVVIIGWGVGKVKGHLLGGDYDSKTMYAVPYWIVRNSWGTTWNNGGYFNMAHYPFNKKSQFDVTVTVRSSVLDEKTKLYTVKDVPTSGLLLVQPRYFGYENPNDLSFHSVLTVPEKEPTTIENFETPSPVAPVAETCTTCGREPNAVVTFFIALLVLATIVLFIMILVHGDSNTDTNASKTVKKSQRNQKTLL